MILPEHFKVFLKIISLNSTREGRIDSAMSNFNCICDEDRGVNGAFIEWFRHGSFAHGTVIKPLNDGMEYDVDITLVLDLDKLRLASRNPRAVVAWLADRIRAKYDRMIFLENVPLVRQKNRCVRIEYQRDFHFDIVPAYYRRDFFTGEEDHSFLYVPDRGTNKWIRSNPEGMNNWFKTINGKTKGDLRRLVKMLKCWRENKFDRSRAPRSVVLEALAGYGISGDNGTAEDLFINTLNNIEEWLRKQFLLFGLTVDNPALPSENLARGWRDRDIRLFRDKLTSAIQWGIEAYNSRSEEKSVMLWQKVFGPNFPRVI